MLKINIFFCSIYFCYFILCCSEKNYFVFYAVFTKLIYAINFFNSCKLIQSNNSQVSRHWKNFSRGELLLISTDTIWKLLTSWVFTQNIAKTFIIRDIWPCYMFKTFCNVVSNLLLWKLFLLFHNVLKPLSLSLATIQTELSWTSFFWLFAFYWYHQGNLIKKENLFKLFLFWYLMNSIYWPNES